MVTPIYFAAEALSSSTLCKMYLVFKGLTFLVMRRTWHLENCISHIFSHCSRHARLVCRTWPSVVELIARYMAVSSAKSLTLNLTCSGRSLMYARKRNWNENEPCGTPEKTGTSFEGRNGPLLFDSSANLFSSFLSFISSLFSFHFVCAVKSECPFRRKHKSQNY